jgi:LmbE family N-acetylglucosaminyl deacetylase
MSPPQRLRRGAIVLSDAEVERALVVTAHPDDVDFGASGTVSTWSDAGVAVTYCVCTDGQAGGFDPELPRERIPEIRRAEQIAAAQVAGVTDVRFLGYVDGELEVTRDLVRDIVRVIRQVRPQRVMLMNPERWWDRIGASHADHMASGEATIRAVYPESRNPFAFPELLADEGLDAWTVPEVWVMAVPDPNHFVDVTDQFERKIRAIMAHESQHPDRDKVPDMVRTWMVGNAERAALPEGRLAEAFRVHSTG